MEKRDWIRLPNLLTLLRVALAIALFIIYPLYPARGHIAALPLFLLAGLTDCLDGYFARRLGQVTELGKVLDPVADKLLMAAVLFSLAKSGSIGWFLPVVIVIKEVCMAAGAWFCLRRRLEVAADLFGKAATLLFYPAVLLVWDWHGVAVLSRVGAGLLCLSVGASIIAAVHYALASLATLKKMKSGAEH